VYEAKVDFDADLSKYGIKKGVFINEAEREVYAPVAMWLEAVDLVLRRLADKGTPFGRIKGISGAGQQHGSVYWRLTGAQLLSNLKPEESLVGQLKEAFAHPFSPNWQDASTQKECDAFDSALASEERLAEATGSKAHHVSRLLLSLIYIDEGYSVLPVRKLCVFISYGQRYIAIHHASHLYHPSLLLSSSAV
jgi:xylulokinase